MSILVIKPNASAEKAYDMFFFVCYFGNEYEDFWKTFSGSFRQISTRPFPCLMFVRFAHSRPLPRSWPADWFRPLSNWSVSQPSSPDTGRELPDTDRRSDVPRTSQGDETAEIFVQSHSPAIQGGGYNNPGLDEGVSHEPFSSARA
jgi:hypothetical protein